MRWKKNKQIQLNKSISFYLPEFKHPKANQITIQQLLDHKSGFTYFYRLVREMGFNPRKFMSQTINKKDLLTGLSKIKLREQPGKRQITSMFNYILLGYILENISQQSINGLIQQYLELKDTKYHRNIPSNSIPNYHYDPANLKKPFQIKSLGLQSMRFTSEGLFSTTADLFKISKSAPKITDTENSIYQGWSLIRKGIPGKHHKIPTAYQAGGRNDNNVYIAVIEDGKWTLILLSQLDHSPIHAIAGNILAHLYKGQPDPILNGPREWPQLTKTLSKSDPYWQDFAFYADLYFEEVSLLIKANQLIIAQEIINEGKLRHPNSYYIELAQGHLFYATKQMKKAELHLQKGIENAPINNDRRNRLLSKSKKLLKEIKAKRSQ